MAKIEIPSHMRALLGPEMKMDVHWIDIKLQDGRTLKNLVVRGGAYITGFADSPNGDCVLDFDTDDIANLRRHRLLAAWP